MSAAMTLACHAALRLPQADRVLFKLCKHYALKVRVDFDPLAADIHFPYGRCRLKREGELLLIHGQAASPEALAQVRHVMDEHLALMARNPQLRLDWQDTTPIPQDDLPARLRTTTAQYGIWVAQQVDAHEPGFWTGEAVQLDGALDAPALREAIHSVLMQARGLHVRIRHEDDVLWQWPQPPLVDVTQLDFSTEADPATAAQAWMQHSLARPCDVSQDPLLHTAVLRLGPQRHLWFLQVHHIVLDGFGYQLVQQAVAARYSARVSGQPLPTLPQWDPRPVIEAEARYHAEGRRAADQAFWREHLRHVPAPAVVNELHDSAHDAWRHTLHLDATHVQALQAAAQQATLAALATHPSTAGAAHARTAPTDWTPWLLTALTLWLARQSGQRHLCVGLPVMNRLGTPALGVPCMAMNIVPVMLHVPPGASLAELVAAMAVQLRQIRPHLYYRYGWIRGDLGLLESGTFLFNQAVNLMPFDRRLHLAGLHSRVLPQSGGPVKDLNLALVVLDGRWQLTLEANPLSYPPERAQALADDLATWLARLSAHAPTAALDALLPELGAPSVLEGGPLPEAAQPLLARLMAHVQARPTHPALHWPDDTGTWHTWDYATLNQRIDALAQALHPLLLPTAPGTPEAACTAPPTVAVMLERSPEAVLAMWALWRLGAVYVPLDPHGPPQRRQAMLEAARPALVLTRQRWLAALPGGTHLQGSAVLCLDSLRLAAPDATPPSATTAATALPAWQVPEATTPAALLFTSGSTGRPKGVLIGHGALAQFVSSAQALYTVTPADRVLQFAPLGFDASLEELLMSLCHGATLVLRDEAMLESPQAFARNVRHLGLSVLDLPTAYWQVLAQSLPPQEAPSLAGVRLVLIGGEAALPEALARWRALLPGTRLLNTYGPTEASIIVSIAALAGPQADGQPVPWQPGQPVPIGRPRPGVRLTVVDHHGWPVAEGRSGELVIQGEALALGYLATPSVPGVAPGLRPVQEGGFAPLPLIPQPEPTPERAYRTGDRVRLHNGQLLFLGRGDGQVKISGLRIEPAEVENALLALPGVQEAAVLAEPLPGGGWRLVACVAGAVTADASTDGAPEDSPVPACGLGPRLHAWRHALLQSLPAPAVPDVWLALPALPRNPHGKIDRRALHAQRAAQSAAASNGTGLAHAGGAGEAASVADHTLRALLATVLRAWEHVLGPQATLQALGPDSHFFALGGKSLQAIQVAAWLSRELGREVAMSLLFRHPRAAALAQALSAPTAHEAPRDQDAFAPQLTLQHGPADAPVLWCLHPAEGLAWSYLRLARHLPGLTLHGLQIDLTAMETLPADFDALVTHYLARLRAAQPRGPYHLLGWSLGGSLAQALAARLQAEGDAVAGLYLLDAYPAESWQAHPVPQQAEALRTLLGVLGDFDTTADPPERLLARLLRAGSPFERLGRAGVQRLASATLAQTQAFRASRSRPFGGPVVFYQALRNPPGSPQPAQWQPWLDTTRWAHLALDCSHDALSDPVPMAAIAADLAQRLGTDFHPATLTTATTPA